MNDSSCCARMVWCVGGWVKFISFLKELENMDSMWERVHSMIRKVHSIIRK